MGRNKLFETDFFGRFLYCDLTTANIEFGGSVFELLFFLMQGVVRDKFELVVLFLF